MYKGLNLSISSAELRSPKNYSLSNLHPKFSGAKDGLEKYFSDGILSAKDIQADWFTKLEIPIFISHSHKDEELAVNLAGIIYERFKIVSFVDSTVWGHSNDLLKSLDNKYCLNEGKGTYSYEKRNYSTAHVHAMVFNALSMMIDQAECVIFLNTPNSIVPKSVIGEDATTSPWIYTELEISRTIRRRQPQRVASITEAASKRHVVAAEQLNIQFPARTDHLDVVNVSVLTKWLSTPASGLTALDSLYKQIDS